MINFPNEQNIRRSFLAQRHLAQLHRWITLQIEPRVDSTDLVTPTFNCILNGQPSSLADLSAAVRTHPPTHLGSNDQIWPNPCSSERVSSSTLVAKFEESELPLLDEIALTHGYEDHEVPHSTAIEHRILALKHRWHAIVEAPKKTPAALKELIAPSFNMEWGYGGLTGFSELSNWLTKSAASMDAARHDIAAFAWETTGPHTYQAEFEFVWYGYSHELEPMHAESRHVWQIEDDLQDRYPRIRHMSVDFITPFHTVSGVNHD